MISLAVCVASLLHQDVSTAQGKAVSARVLPAVARVGEPVLWTIDLRLEAGDRLEVLEAPGTQPVWSEVEEMSGSSPAVGSTFRLRLVASAAGEFLLGPALLRWHRRDSADAVEVRVPAVPVSIRSNVAAGVEPMMVALLPVPATRSLLQDALLAVLCLLAGLLVGGWLRNDRRRRRPWLGENPGGWARQKLKRLAETCRQKDPGPVRVYAQLTWILRQYFSHGCGIPAPFQSREEFGEALGRAAPSLRVHRAGVEQLFATADLLKFSRQALTAAPGAEAVARALALVGEIEQGREQARGGRRKA